MPVFVDTSALYAALNSGDERHQEARQRLTDLLQRDDLLITTNYVVVETAALLARRLGLDAVRSFETDLLPALDVIWVDPAIHRRAVNALLAAGRRDLSLVDCVSFEVMRDHGLRDALAFDRHFTEHGFRCL